MQVRKRCDAGGIGFWRECVCAFVPASAACLCGLSAHSYTPTRAPFVQSVRQVSPRGLKASRSIPMHSAEYPRSLCFHVLRVVPPDVRRAALFAARRFVGEFGGHGNMAAVRVAMHAALWRRGVDPLKVDPWYFPTPHEYRRLLEAVSRGSSLALCGARRPLKRPHRR